MRNIAITLAAIIGAITMLGCQGTNNSSTPSTAPVAQSCVTNSYGQSINSANGLPCYGATGSCTGQQYSPYGYNPTNGYACTGYGTYGGSGYGSGYGLGGCQYWSQIYPGTQYVPMIDPSSGQLECINVSSYGISVPSGYNYQQPVYVVQQCTGNPYYDQGNPYCYNGWAPYGNYGSYGGYSGGGTCLGAGSGDGSFFGLCF